MLKEILTGSIAILGLASVATAKDIVPAAPTIPSEMKQYDYFLGTWRCSGKTFASPMGPQHATTATVHANKAVGGRWVRLTYDEKKTAANPAPYHIGVYLGYDSAKKVFVENCHDSFGGYCTQTGSGWSGDTLTFEGMEQGMEDAGMVRDTFMKKGAKELMHTGEIQGPDKKWMKTDEETCHKVK